MLASKLKTYHRVAKISHQVALKGSYAFLIALSFEHNDILKNYFLLFIANILQLNCTNHQLTGAGWKYFKLRKIQRLGLNLHFEGYYEHYRITLTIFKTESHISKTLCSNINRFRQMRQYPKILIF